MRNSIILISVLLSIIAAFSCNNSFGTDDDVIIIPIDQDTADVNPGPKLSALDSERISAAVSENLWINNSVRTFNWHDNYWNDIFTTETKCFRIDSSAVPLELYIETKIRQNFPMSYLSGRKYIIESAYLKISKIPIIKSSLMDCSMFPLAECKLELKDLVTGKIHKVEIAPKDVKIVFSIISPYINLGIYVNTSNNLCDEFIELNYSHSFYVN